MKGRPKKYNYNLKAISELESSPDYLSYLTLGKRLSIPQSTIHDYLIEHTDKFVIRFPKGEADEQTRGVIDLLRDMGNREYAKEQRSKQPQKIDLIVDGEKVK